MTAGQKLTDTQIRQILDMLNTGQPIVRIAAALNISRHTVANIRSHRSTLQPVGQAPKAPRWDGNRPPDQMTWMDDAACVPFVGTFDNEERGIPKAKVTIAAKAICKTCPVIDPCREWGAKVAYVGSKIEGPVFGGMTGYELHRQDREHAA